jgi:hypothetical protein
MIEAADHPRTSLKASNYLVMRKLLIAFVIVFGWTAESAAGQTSAAGALADAFVDAWNTHDVRAFGAGCTPMTRTGSRWAAKDTRVASQSKACSRRSTRVGLARRFFARRALPFGRSIPKMRS